MPDLEKNNKKPLIDSFTELKGSIKKEQELTMKIIHEQNSSIAEMIYSIKCAYGFLALNLTVDETCEDKTKFHARNILGDLLTDEQKKEGLEIVKTL